MSNLEEFIKKFSYEFTFQDVYVTRFKQNGDWIETKMFSLFRNKNGHLEYIKINHGTRETLETYLRGKAFQHFDNETIVISPLAITRKGCKYADDHSPAAVVIYYNYKLGNSKKENIKLMEKVLNVFVENVENARDEEMHAYKSLKMKISFQVKWIRVLVKSMTSYLADNERVHNKAWLEAVNSLDDLIKNKRDDLDEDQHNLVKWNVYAPYLPEWWSNKYPHFDEQLFDERL